MPPAIIRALSRAHPSLTAPHSLSLSHPLVFLPLLLALSLSLSLFQASTATGAARSARTSTLASATVATAARVPNHLSMAAPPQAASKSTTRRSGRQPPRSSRRQLCSLFRRLERARGLFRLSPCPVHASVLCLRSSLRDVPVVPLSRCACRASVPSVARPVA